MLDFSQQYSQSLADANVFSRTDIETLSCVDKISRHSFYVELADWLAPLCSEAGAASVSTIKLLGFHMLQGLLYFDTLLDKGHTPSYRYALVHYQQACKLICAMPRLTPDFWSDFGVLQQRYFHAIDTERKWDADADIDVTLFETISADKSAIVELIPMLLAGSAFGNEEWQAVTESLRWVHIGMQYVDDVRDIQEDIRGNQVTFVYLETLKRIAQLREPRQLSPTSIVQYMAVTGEAEIHFERAALAYKAALALVSPLPLPKYQSFIEERIEEAQRMQSETRELRLRAFERARILALPAAARTHDRSVDVEAARKRAADFLIGELAAPAGLLDFRTDQGYSDIWLNAFVCCNLLQSGVHDTRLSAAAEQVCSASGLQGFNSRTPPDGDTLSFLIHLNWLVNDRIPDKLLEGWTAHQSAGAWSTYRDEAIRPTSGNTVLASTGWCAAHSCVSAMAAYVLRESQIYPGLLERSLANLTATQTTSGNWNAYWWTDDVYATAYAIAALGKTVECAARYRAPLTQGMSWICSRQNPDGSWSERDNRAFYTSVALIGLLSFSETPHAVRRHAIRAGIDWLLSEQKLDGRWLGGRCLRVPHPSVVTPSDIAEWRNASAGYNICVQEQSGYLTTSLAVYALSLYRNLSEEETCR